MSMKVLIHDQWRSLYIQSTKRLKYTMFKWYYLKGQSLHKIMITRPILHKQRKRHIFTHIKANGLVFQTTAETSVMLSSDRILYAVTRCAPAFSEVPIFAFLHKNVFCKKNHSVPLSRSCWSLKMRMLLSKGNLWYCRTQHAHGVLVFVDSVIKEPLNQDEISPVDSCEVVESYRKGDENSINYIDKSCFHPLKTFYYSKRPECVDGVDNFYFPINSVNSI